MKGMIYFLLIEIGVGRLKNRNFVILFLFILVFMGVYFYIDDFRFFEKIVSSHDVEYTVAELKPEDFFSFLEEARAKNKDAYAWIRVDGTKINYPIVRHEKDNTYYLNHDAENNATSYGAIFTENYNSKNFLDDFIIIYGHSMVDKTMFGGIKLFRDKEFFDTHEDVTIYFDNEIYTYKIIAAYSVDNEHFFSKYDLTTKKKIQDYYHKIEKIARDDGGNYRKVDTDNLKMITLSTCNSSVDDKRYIIQAVLKKKERIR